VNSEQLIMMVVSAVLNGVMLAVGMMIGTRLTAKSMRKEVEDMMEKSETVQMLKKFLTDQTLISKATKFFEEATTLVSSPEAKNFFKNMTQLMRELSSDTSVKFELPKRTIDTLPEAADYSESE